MKTTSFPIAMLASSLAVFVPGNRLAAQAVPPLSNRPELEEPFVLSPFVVNTERDTGYQATSTLAGTRLNTPIKDLAASISIYTKDFLDDIGATEAAQLMAYATGMEVGGISGNYSGASNDINADRPDADAVRRNPQGSTRTRGLITPTFTRGYFPTSLAFDAYNTSTVTVNRGPNAALFGTGSAAGVVDTALLAANTSKDSTKVIVRYGNNDALRSSVDFNRVLAKDKLAARIALLDDRERYNQRPAFQNKRRIFGALTFAPTRSTTLKGNFESGNTKANRPISFIPSNSISEAWYRAGRPGLDWTFYDDPARNPAAAATVLGPTQEGPLMGVPTFFGPIIVYNNPTDRSAAFGFNYRDLTTSTYGANAIASQIFNSAVNQDVAADNIRFIYTNNQFYFPATYWVGENTPKNQQPGSVPVGMKLQSFSDFSAFDWKHHMIDETSRQGDAFHTFNLSLAQTAWGNRLGIELAYDRQRYDQHSRAAFFSDANTGQIYLDVNAALPDGSRNPNYGRPMAASTNARWRDSFEEREGQRVTAFARYDCNDLKSRWAKLLGRHTLTGVYEHQSVYSLSNQRRFALTGFGSEAADPGNITASNRRPTVLVYLGPSLIGNSNPLRLSPIQIPPLNVGPTAPISTFVRAADRTDPGHFELPAGNLVDINSGGSVQREVIKSQAFVLQSSWLNDLLVTTAGWRRDDDYFARQTIAYVPNPADRNDPGKASYGLNDFSLPRTPPFSVGKEIKSIGAVLAWPKKLLKLPADCDLSVFANRSSNFTPIGGRVNPFNESIASPEGTTHEYGVNLDIPKAKLNVRINRFETAITGTSGAPSFFSQVTNATLGLARNWAIEGNLNPQLKAKRDADIELLFSPLPSNFRSLYGWTVTGAPPNIASSVTLASVQSTDTVDVVAKGWEMDCTFNPTANLRILLNVAQQETVQSNMYPFSKGFVALMKPVWAQLADTPAGAYPTGFQLGSALPANVQTYGQYLDINVFVPMASALAAEGTASAEQRKWRANLIANYTFGRGSIWGERLHGFGLGGAWRWQDKLGLGYPSSRAANGSASFDLQHPYYAPAETNVDLWISYERKLWKRRLGWKAQLNVSNAFSTSNLVGTSVQSWSGTIAQYRLAPERRWYLTNTFSF